MYNAKPDFSSDYQESRGKFLSASERLGQVHSVLHPEKGPDGGDLFLDFAVFGPDDAEGGLLLIAGTHGPEIFAGSGPQTALLNAGMLQNYADLRVVMVHAHNPFGSAWLRRTDHLNVDLNRNYCDFSEPFIAHPGYDDLRPIIVPDEWDAATLAQGLKDYELEHGKIELLAAMLSGQGHDPDGMFFRGEGPAWSRLQMEEMLPRLFAKQQTVSCIDFHTGLGPYGIPYMVHGYEPGSAEFLDFQSAYEGEVRSVCDPDDIDEDLPTAPAGPFVLGFDKVLPGKQTYAVVIEYGTVPTGEVFPALMEDNWMHANGDPSSAEWARVKAEMSRVFYPPEDKWKDMIWERAVWAIERSAKLARRV